MFSIDDAKNLLTLVNDAGIKVFLDGGWGIDALVGYESRPHNDIDIFVEKKDATAFVSLITDLGFRETQMEYTTPNHTVWEDESGRIIDLHCFEYGADGTILFEGEHYPADVFSGKGAIGGIQVACIEPRSQVFFHLGYDFDENDRKDVALLCETFQIEIPDEYK